MPGFVFGKYNLVGVLIDYLTNAYLTSLLVIAACNEVHALGKRMIKGIQSVPVKTSWLFSLFFANRWQYGAIKSITPLPNQYYCTKPGTGIKKTRINIISRLMFTNDHALNHQIFNPAYAPFWWPHRFRCCGSCFHPCCGLVVTIASASPAKEAILLPCRAASA